MVPESTSLATLPKMSGMTIKNENLAALDLSTLSSTAVAIVAPDLEIPGSIAIPWAKPMITAWL